MLKAMIRGLLAHKLRLLLSALAIILGTMFMSGAFIGGHTINKGLDELFAEVGSNIDVQVKGKTDVSSFGSDELVTVTVPQDVVDKIAAVDGVAEAVPAVFSDGARVIDKHGKVVPSVGAPRFGIGWSAAAVQLNSIQLREGNPPAQRDEVAISANLAQDTGYGVGDTIEVITLEPRQPFRVTGVTELTDGRDSLGGETYVFFIEEVAQRVMLGAGPGKYSNVDVRAASGTAPQALKDRIQTAVGDGYDVQTGAEVSEAAAGPIKAVFGVLATVLAAFGILALLTGIFLIFNTFAMLIAQRTRELALYRSFGAGKGQVLRSVLFESALLGLVASIAGLIIGMGVGWLIKWAIGAIGGSPLPGSGVVVKPWVILTTLAAGTVVTVLAALVPAIRASRVAPIEAMRDAATADKPLRKLTIVGIVTLLAGVVLLILRGTKTVESLWLTLAPGALLTFLGTVMIAPVLTPITRWIGRVFGKSAPGQLGVRNTGRNPRRTALTAAALMIGVTLATGVGVFASSAKAGLSDLFEQDLNADLMLQADFAAGPTAGFDPGLQEQLQQIPGVTAAAVFQQDAVRLADQDALALATDAGALRIIVRAEPRSGELRALQPGEVILNDGFSTTLDVGSEITMETARATTVPLRVIGILEPNQLIGSPIISPVDAAGFRSPLAQQAYVKVDDAADIAAVREQLETLVADNPEVAVADPADQLKQVTSFFDLLLVVINVLLGLTLLVAMLGVINTLLLSVFERTRELGLLRAVGLGRAKVGWMITIESILISLFGALLGLVLGAALGVTVVKLLGGDFLRLTIPWGYLIGILAASVVAGMLAALLPAFRAARLNVLEAIAYE